MHCSWQIARHNSSNFHGRQLQLADLPWPGWLEHDDVLKAHPELLSSSINHSESKNDNFVDDTFALRAWEYQWTHIQPWLESKGYMIRPRFRPGWIPSWTSTSNTRKVRRPYGRCEDAVVHSVGRFIPIVCCMSLLTANTGGLRVQSHGRHAHSRRTQSHVEEGSAPNQVEGAGSEHFPLFGRPFT